MTAYDNNLKTSLTDAASVNEILNGLAKLLLDNKSAICSANADDIKNCPGSDEVIRDRLFVDEKKVEKMIESIRKVIDLPSKIGTVVSTHVREDGLKIENRLVPFGTVLIIYEARPDVSVEAAAIALKAGNRILLKGGKEARGTNMFLVELWQQALKLAGFDPRLVKYLDLTRDETKRLIAGETEKFDLVIPRGGNELIDFTLRNSNAPVLVSGRGNNFLFIADDANFEMALAVALDGKTRLSVCNALDKILIDKNLPDLENRVEKIVDGFEKLNVAVSGDAAAVMADQRIIAVTDEAVWHEEFLSAKLVIGIVNNLSDAIEKINQYSGGHSAAIITQDIDKAAEFMNLVDGAAVYHNASTRFTDGGEFGLGAEIAISTQKLHFRGPLGSEHLLTNKWFVFGDGHVRN